jgi:hypothetical protein
MTDESAVDAAASGRGGAAPSPVPDPPDAADLDIRIEVWSPEQPIYRVHRVDRSAVAFNSGYGPPTRFAFFEDPFGITVPIWYGGATEVAIGETLFHDLPLGPGAFLPYEKYQDRACSVVYPGRPLSLVALHGIGLRAIGLWPRELTDTDASEYHRTVRWAKTFHSHPFGVDGLVWMSRQFNTHKAASFVGPLRAKSWMADGSAGPSGRTRYRAQSQKTNLRLRRHFPISNSGRLAWTPPAGDRYPSTRRYLAACRR